MTRWFVPAVAVALAASGFISAVGVAQQPARRDSVAAPTVPLVVRVLDVGQGDATLIENGTSKILIDGGPEPSRLGKLLDSLKLNNSTIDVVILTHQHADHLMGLRALFESARHIRVRFFFENKDPYSAANLRYLRDSINARAGRGELVYRDTDDPCANGTHVCTITMNGGARVHIMRPMPSATDPNDRSTPVKLVGPDSTAFSMWFAGDAEQEAIEWFLGAAHYDVNPGMHVDVLKADHHGSCNGVTAKYLDALHPAWIATSVGSANGYHHMHDQAKAVYEAHRIPWYRTDRNGTIEIHSPAAGGAPFSIAVLRGTRSMDGRSDQRSAQEQCNPIP